MIGISQAAAVDPAQLSAGDHARFWRARRHDGLEGLTATFQRHRYAPHNHETYAIGVFVGGCEAYHVRGARHYAGAGDLVFVNPGEVHDGEPFGAGYAYRITSLSYLGANGTPEHPNDLAHHQCIGMCWPTNRSAYRWEFERNGEEIRMPVNGPLVCDEPQIRLQAAVDGLGLAYVFEHEAAAFLTSGQLLRVLEDWTSPFPGCFLYYPGRRHVASALRAFIDFARRGS